MINFLIFFTIVTTLVVLILMLIKDIFEFVSSYWGLQKDTKDLLSIIEKSFEDGEIDDKEADELAKQMNTVHKSLQSMKNEFSDIPVGISRITKYLLSLKMKKT